MRFRIRLRRFSRPVLALMISLCLVTTGSSRSPSDGEYDPLSIHSAFMVTGKRLVASGDYPEIDLDRIYLEDLLTRFGYFRQPLGEPGRPGNKPYERPYPDQVNGYSNVIVCRYHLDADQRLPSIDVYYTAQDWPVAIKGTTIIGPRLERMLAELLFPPSPAVIPVNLTPAIVADQVTAVCEHRRHARMAKLFFARIVGGSIQRRGMDLLSAKFPVQGGSWRLDVVYRPDSADYHLHPVRGNN